MVDHDDQQSVRIATDERERSLSSSLASPPTVVIPSGHCVYILYLPS